jgi:hypothetical protein
MKTITKIAAITATGLLLLAAAPQRAQADDKTWATVGKILTGFVVADKVFNPPARYCAEPVRTYTTVTYRYGAPVYCEPPPPRYCPPPAPRWIPGHYQTRCEQVWVEGYWKTIETPAVYDWVWNPHCRRYEWTMVRPPTCTRVWVPGRYETREVRVWVEGRYVYN